MDRRDFLVKSGSLAALAGVAQIAVAKLPQGKEKKEKSMASKVPQTFIRRVEADGVNVFYREAGAADAPVVLLLHGFPTSSFQYRELIPRLADRYRVIAPDLPGFGLPGRGRKTIFVVR